MSDLTETPRTSPPMVVLRPGDRVLVTLTEEIVQADVDEMAYALRQAFPGVDFTILTGVASILVGNGGT